MNESKKMSVYIETSVISYLTNKISRDLVVAAHQEVTQEWWETCRNNYHLVISELVYNEIEAGDKTASQRRKELIQDIDFLKIDEEATRLAEAFLERGILPRKASEDALHIAIATKNNVDYLLTWNCKHIANAEIQKIIMNLCYYLEYNPPLICTPLELMDRYNYE